MTAPTDLPRPVWRTAAVMAVAGGLFAGLAAATWSTPPWVAAAAINLIAATDAFLRWYRPSVSQPSAAASVG